MPLEALHLWRRTRQIFAGRTMLLAEDHGLGRGSWSWQRMMILAQDDAEDEDAGRGSWSWQRVMLLAEKHVPTGTTRSCWKTMNHRSKTTLGPPPDHFRQNPKMNFPSFVGWFGINLVTGSWVIQKSWCGCKMPAAISLYPFCSYPILNSFLFHCNILQSHDLVVVVVTK